MSKPIEFPCWRYHKVHQPVLVKSHEEYESLHGDKAEWHDNLAAVGGKMEVYENGGHQVVRHIKAEDIKAEVKAAPVGDQGQGGQGPLEDLAEASEDRLREILLGHGYPSKKLEKKSKKQLLALLAE